MATFMIGIGMGGEVDPDAGYPGFVVEVSGHVVVSGANFQFGRHSCSDAGGRKKIRDCRLVLEGHYERGGGSRGS